ECYSLIVPFCEHGSRAATSKGGAKQGHIRLTIFLAVIGGAPVIGDCFGIFGPAAGLTLREVTLPVLAVSQPVYQMSYIRRVLPLVLLNDRQRLLIVRLSLCAHFRSAFVGPVHVIELKQIAVRKQKLTQTEVVTLRT